MANNETCDRRQRQALIHVRRDLIEAVNGTLDDIAVVRRYLDLEDFREALENAPPGIIDERSWAYWNVMTGRDPAPPMPRRIIPD